MSDAQILADAYAAKYWYEHFQDPESPLTKLYRDRWDFWSELAMMEEYEGVDYDILVRINGLL